MMMWERAALVIELHSRAQFATWADLEYIHNPYVPSHIPIQGFPVRVPKHPHVVLWHRCSGPAPKGEAAECSAHESERRELKPQPSPCYPGGGDKVVNLTLFPLLQERDESSARFPGTAVTMK